MAAPPPMPAPGSARAGAGASSGPSAVSATFNITIALAGGDGAPSAAQQVQDPGLTEGVTKMLKEAAAAAGIVLVQGA
ncbi:MAG: hypothetical protein QOG85_22 [Gaiellaceae bacterium]|nr:hypothetical protein [Gaiellaceae bacterium]